MSPCTTRSPGHWIMIPPRRCGSRSPWRPGGSCAGGCAARRRCWRRRPSTPRPAPMRGARPGCYSARLPARPKTRPRCWHITPRPGTPSRTGVVRRHRRDRDCCRCAWQPGYRHCSGWAGSPRPSRMAAGRCAWPGRPALGLSRQWRWAASAWQFGRTVTGTARCGSRARHMGSRRVTREFCGEGSAKSSPGS